MDWRLHWASELSLGSMKSQCVLALVSEEQNGWTLVMRICEWSLRLAEIMYSVVEF